MSPLQDSRIFSANDRYIKFRILNSGKNYEVAAKYMTSDPEHHRHYIFKSCIMNAQKTKSCPRKSAITRFVMMNKKLARYVYFLNLLCIGQLAGYENKYYTASSYNTLHIIANL